MSVFLFAQLHKVEINYIYTDPTTEFDLVGSMNDKQKRKAMQNNKQYDWHLANSAELRRLGNDWQVCPQCGRKEFKPYVNLAGEPLARECGRCNREINCQYHLPPKEYLPEHPDVQVEKVERVQVAPKKPIFMPVAYLF